LGGGLSLKKKKNKAEQAFFDIDATGKNRGKPLHVSQFFPIFAP